MSASSKYTADTSNNVEISEKYLLSETSSYIFLTIDITLLTILVYFHSLLHLMLKRENQRSGQDLLKDLLSCYIVITPVSFLLIFSYINIFAIYSESPSTLIGSEFCDVFETMGHATIVYIGCFSVFVACVKFCFLNKHASTIQFGEDRAKRIAVIFHLVIPILLGILNSISNGDKDQIFWVEHCWGFNGRSNTSGTGNEEYGMLREIVCLDRQYEEVNRFYGDNDTRTIVATRALRSICGAVNIFYLLFLSNGMEFIIYIFVVRYLYR